MRKLFSITLLAFSFLTTQVKAADDFKELYEISAIGGLTTVVGITAITAANPAAVAGAGVSYSKFVLVWTPIALVAFSSVTLAEKYQTKKAAIFEARSLLLEKNMTQMSSYLKSAINELKEDMQAIEANRDVDSIEALNALENNSGLMSNIDDFTALNILANFN
jgi:hypothetical protein